MGIPSLSSRSSQGPMDVKIEDSILGVVLTDNYIFNSVPNLYGAEHAVHVPPHLRNTCAEVNKNVR